MVWLFVFVFARQSLECQVLGWVVDVIGCRFQHLIVMECKGFRLIQLKFVGQDLQWRVVVWSATDGKLHKWSCRVANNVFDYRSHYSSIADGVPQPGSWDPAAGLRRYPPVRYTAHTWPMPFQVQPAIPVLFQFFSRFYFSSYYIFHLFRLSYLFFD